MMNRIGPVRESFELVHDSRNQRRELRVDQEQPFVAHLHRDVAAGSGDHVDVALHGQDAQLDRVEVLGLERGRRS